MPLGGRGKEQYTSACCTEGTYITKLLGQQATFKVQYIFVRYSLSLAANSWDTVTKGLRNFGYIWDTFFTRQHYLSNFTILNKVAWLPSWILVSHSLMCSLISSSSVSWNTTKHRFLLQFKWNCHDSMVYTEHAEMAAVTCGTSHASAVSTPLPWILKTHYKKLFTHVESHACTVSAWEQRIALYKSIQQQQQLAALLSLWLNSFNSKPGQGTQN